MPPTIEDLQNDLNKLYFTDPDRYMERLNVIKGIGYKVLRNSQGKHRVQMDMSTAFGGVFNKIFNP